LKLFFGLFPSYKKR